VLPVLCAMHLAIKRPVCVRMALERTLWHQRPIAAAQYVQRSHVFLFLKGSAKRPNLHLPPPLPLHPTLPYFSERGGTIYWMKGGGGLSLSPRVVVNGRFAAATSLNLSTRRRRFLKKFPARFSVSPFTLFDFVHNTPPDNIRCTYSLDAARRRPRRGPPD